MFLANTIGCKIYSRVVSLVPSQTELLFALGLDSEVLGITKFCIHPEKWFKTKKRVGGTKKLHLSEIHSLKPDLIIANKEENVKEEIEELAKKFDVWVTDVNNLADAIKMIQDIGELTGKEKTAYLLQRDILQKFVQLRNETKDQRLLPGAYFIWKDPYMVAGGGTFINDMLPRAGIENVFAKEPRYPSVDLKMLKDKKCEIILLSSEPYPFKEKQQEEIDKIFPKMKIFLVDGEMFSWYGSRLSKAPDYFKTLNQQFKIQIKTSK